MNRVCKCGGTMQPRSDNPVYFSRRCDRCGVVAKQRKRKARQPTFGPVGR